MKATAVLLNWKRPDNLKKVIESIKKQGDVEILLWNNNPDDHEQYSVHQQHNSPENRFCWPRWLIAETAKSEYVFTLDDDLMFTEDNVIDQCIDFIKYLPKDTILGLGGVILNKEKDYKNSTHAKKKIKTHDLKVDIVKGRFMFTRKEFIESIPKNHYHKRGDDIYISSFSKNKILPVFLDCCFTSLPEKDVGLKKNREHIEIRQEVVNKYFKDQR